MKLRNAFTMIELIFVILIMGIIGKFGVEFMAQAYQNYMFSTINYTLQSNSATTVEILATRLQHRIKSSVIARKNNGNLNDFKALSSATGTDYDILEWVGTDIDGFRGDTDSTWSGIIDLDANNTNLVSPGTVNADITAMISTLSSGGSYSSSINTSALYFIGSDNDIDGYGWDGNPIGNQNAVMHPIQSLGTDRFEPKAGTATFSGTEIFEYYKLAWSAYAIVLSSDGNLTLHYDYQPWNGDTYEDKEGDTVKTKRTLLMQNVDTFRFMSIGSIIKIQVCVFSDLFKDTKEDMGYSICKEKTIY